MAVLGSISSENLNVVWETDDKGTHTVTLYQMPKDESKAPKKLKSMSYKGKS